MTVHRLPLVLLPGRFAVCRLPPDVAPSPFDHPGELFSLTRTPDELSLVCREETAPPKARVEAGWRCLRIAGVIDFATTGVLAALTAPLAEAGIGVFVLSTFDTDYLLVKEPDLEDAVAALRRQGHTFA